MRRSPSSLSRAWLATSKETRGELGDEDKAENDLSLKEGFRILSAYESGELPKIWIITEADRSATTILFPDEY